MDHAALLEEIHSMIDAPTGGTGRPSLDRIEHVLTAGYARALALEAERWRIERQIGELAAALAEGPVELRTDELAALSRRMAVADGDLVRLRTALASLRERANAVRIA